MKIERLENNPIFIPIIAKWLYDQWGWKHPDGSIDRAKRNLSCPPDSMGLPIAFVAVDDDTPIGVARLKMHDMDARKDLSPWLASVFVHPGQRGLGIGTALCTRVVSEAGMMGFTKLYLFTPDRESFYVRQGWQTIERAIYRDEEVVIMKIEP